MNKNSEEFWKAVDKADKITKLSMSYKIDADMSLDPDDFTEEKFDKMIMDRMVKSNAETITQSVSGLSAGEHFISGELKLVAKISGEMIFSGVNNWFRETSRRNPHIKNEDIEYYLSDEKSYKVIISSVKLLMWRSMLDPKKLDKLDKGENNEN